MRSTSSLPRRSSEKAAALIIVLAFVVILTGVSVAYLSRATTDRQLAHTSFHDTDADLLARSALDIVVGDFKVEIAKGSTVSSNVWTPSSPANVVPMRNGNPAIPNLIRRSVRSESSFWPDPVTGPAVGSRASAVNSTNPADVSPNGRSVSLARWNSHYMVLKANTTDTGSDPITTGFAAPNYWAPDWVLVTRSGPAVETGIGSGTTALNNPVSTNVNYVVGRYAYAVYDEGGLLDINVAGYPIPSTAPASWTTDIGRKGVLAFADLTALPATTNAPPNAMTSTAINQAILFRNYATSQTASVTLANTASEIADAFTSGAPLFANYYLGNPRIGTSQDFGSVNPTKIGAGSSIRTDQSFATRAELITLFRSGLPLPQNINALQYLGTFSRERNRSTWGTSLTVLANRFPLNRFELFSSTPPTDAAAVQQRFGLVYVPASGGTPPTPEHWRYVGTSGSTLLSAIQAITNQDPDLFPLLQYALPTATMGEILSIGASLIDQRDSDPNTTWIEYGNAASPSKAFGVDSIPSTDPAAPPPPSNPILLKRPFRNVGELGYAYRNSSSTLHFHTAASTDAPLLDLFTYNTAAPTPGRSGIVSLNTRQPRVLAAILKGAIYKNSDSSVVGNSDATTAANSIVNETSNFTLPHGPALSRADIARLASVVPNSAPFDTEEGQETIARALSEVGQTRTWGLLIDLVAQTGHYAPNAAGLADFIVEGEKRYWLHVAIDRFEAISGGGSGGGVRVLDQQLEEVTE